MPSPAECPRYDAAFQVVRRPGRMSASNTTGPTGMEDHVGNGILPTVCCYVGVAIVAIRLSQRLCSFPFVSADTRFFLFPGDGDTAGRFRSAIAELIQLSNLQTAAVVFSWGFSSN